LLIDELSGFSANSLDLHLELLLEGCGVLGDEFAD
jgi:hypothetical protein